MLMPRPRKPVMMGMALGAPGGRARAAFRAGRVSAYSTSAFWKSSVVVMPMLNASCCRVATPCKYWKAQAQLNATLLNSECSLSRQRQAGGRYQVHDDNAHIDAHVQRY